MTITYVNYVVNSLSQFDFEQVQPSPEPMKNWLSYSQKQKFPPPPITTLAAEQTITMDEVLSPSTLTDVELVLRTASTPHEF